MAVLLAYVLLVAAVGVNAFKQGTPPSIDGHYPGRLGVSCSVVANFDMNGVRGQVHFHQAYRGAPVDITTNLEGLDQYTEQYPWHIHECPINFALLRDFPCSASEIGGHYDPTGAAVNNPDYPEDCASDPDLCEVGDLGGKLGRLQYNRPIEYFTDPRLSLFGPQSPVGRSLVIHRQDGSRWVCANLEYAGVRVHTWRYPFTEECGPFQGEVIIRRVEGKAETTINVDLYRIDGEPVPSSGHLYSLRRGQPSEDGNCSSPYINGIYGENTYEYDRAFIMSRCSEGNQRECFIGDLASKCGSLDVSNEGRIKAFCTDEQLGLVPRSSITPLTLVVQGPNGSDDRIACCTNLPVEPKAAYVYFRTRTLFGNMLFYQTGPQDRTFVRTYVIGLNGEAGYFQIHENPVPPEQGHGEGCDLDVLGDIYDKPGRRLYGDGISSGAGIDTGNLGPIGRLEPKLSNISSVNSYRRTDSSFYLPLFGPYSIIGRSLVLFNAEGEPWACSTIKDWSPVPERIVPSILGYRK